MTFSRNLNEQPQLPLEQRLAAGVLNYLTVNFYCLEATGPDGQTGVRFQALCGALPRVGDVIRLEDGQACQAQAVVWEVRTSRAPDGKIDLVMLEPTVGARLVENLGTLKSADDPNE
jgi:hypothetical protein